MLDAIFYTNAKAQNWYRDQYFNIWKFPTQVPAAERQRRPLILSYSIMTRAYGTCFNDENFIQFFNQHGFDVYLIDWGNETLFTLSGWTLDRLSNTLHEKAVVPLLAEYQVENLNLFGICIGGLIASHMLNTKMKEDPAYAHKFHKISYYGSPIIGGRDLGMGHTFLSFYQAMKPYRPMLDQTGISLFVLDAMIEQSTAGSMIGWFWQRFWEAGPKTFAEAVALTADDRWVPFAAFMDILEEAFAPASPRPEAFHFAGDVSNIHFFNLVGEHDFLVMPSASIIEWGSTIPDQFASFEQCVFNGGHFVFARPGFTEVKERLAAWFAD